MRSIVLFVAVMAFATIVIGVGVRQFPYFPGDVPAARWIQAQSGTTGWAIAVSQLAASPYKYFVMGLTIGLGFALAGWKGGVLALVAIAADQYGAEATKAIFARPRPSPTLINVVGTPTGFSFPSTTMTFFASTFGVLAVLSARAKSNTLKWPVLAGSIAMLLAGAAARVAVGAHWPSDMILTLGLSLGWIWAAARLLL